MIRRERQLRRTRQRLENIYKSRGKTLVEKGKTSARGHRDDNSFTKYENPILSTPSQKPSISLGLENESEDKILPTEEVDSEDGQKIYAFKKSSGKGLLRMHSPSITARATVSCALKYAGKELPIMVLPICPKRGWTNELNQWISVNINQAEIHSDPFRHKQISSALLRYTEGESIPHSLTQNYMDDDWLYDYDYRKQEIKADEYFGTGKLWWISETLVPDGDGDMHCVIKTNHGGEGNKLLNFAETVAFFFSLKPLIWDLSGTIPIAGREVGAAKVHKTGVARKLALHEMSDKGGLKIDFTIPGALFEDEYLLPNNVKIVIRVKPVKDLHNALDAKEHFTFTFSLPENNDIFDVETKKIKGPYAEKELLVKGETVKDKVKFILSNYELTTKKVFATREHAVYYNNMFNKQLKTVTVAHKAQVFGYHFYEKGTQTITGNFFNEMVTPILTFGLTEKTIVDKNGRVTILGNFKLWDGLKTDENWVETIQIQVGDNIPVTYKSIDRLYAETMRNSATTPTFTQWLLDPIIVIRTVISGTLTATTLPQNLTSQLRITVNYKKIRSKAINLVVIGSYNNFMHVNSTEQPTLAIIAPSV